MPRTIGNRADALPHLSEVFREYGYDGASLARITAATGLGKGSLYHFFPGGKEDMAAAVLAEIDRWFEAEIYAPLRRAGTEAEASAAMAAMFDAVEAYFHSGRRICLVGAFALNDARDKFAATIDSYFRRWIEALAMALRRSGGKHSAARAESIVLQIQGGLTLARALDNPAAFTRTMKRLRAEAATPAWH